MPKKKGSKATKVTPRKKKTTVKKTQALVEENKLANPRFRLVIGIVLLILGVYLLNQYNLIRSAKQKAEPRVVKETNAKEPIQASNGLTVPKDTKDPMIRLISPQRDIDVSIVEAEIVDGFWELSETSASHGLGSAYPGMRGNTVIFAHAREGLFLNLKEATVGEEIIILTKNKWHKYKIESIKEVLPDQVEVIQPTKDERLTLFTCSGFADEKRLIVVAKPSK